MSVSLQPLRIPNGWCIQWNTLYEEEPSDPSNAEGYYCGDVNLFLANHMARKLVIDVEWRTEADKSTVGHYRLQVLPMLLDIVHHKQKTAFEVDWEKPFHTFSSSSRLELVAELEHWLAGKKI